MLPLDIEKFPGKVRPTPDENCFTNDTIMQSEVKKISNVSKIINIC